MSRTLLGEIAGDLQAFANLLDDLPGGELTPEAAQVLEEWFESLGAEVDQKVDGYVHLIREAETRAAVRQAEVDRLARSVSADRNLAKRLKDRLQMFLESQGKAKLKTRRYSLSVCGNGGKQGVETLVPPENLPIEFRRVSVAADVDALREALEAGRDVPARLLPRGRHLRIT